MKKLNKFCCLSVIVFLIEPLHSFSGQFLAPPAIIDIFEKAGQIISDRTKQQLISQLLHADEGYDRVDAAEKLGKPDAINEPAVVSALLDAAYFEIERDEFVRNRAVISLGHADIRKNRKIALRLLEVLQKDSADHVRKEAAIALVNADMSDPEIVRGLLEALQRDTSSNVLYFTKETLEHVNMSKSEILWLR
jgi:HEAT repeat protein